VTSATTTFWESWLGHGLVWAPRLTAGIYALARVRYAKRVVVPNNICPSVVHGILLAGAEPVFCEIDLANGGLCPQACAQLLLQFKVDMIIHVHLYGLYTERQEIHQLSRQHGAFFFEDAGLWFPPQLGYELLPESCLGLSFGAQKTFDFGSGGVLRFADPVLAKEVTAVLNRAPGRSASAAGYAEAYSAMLEDDGLPKRRGMDFSSLAERFREHWIGAVPLPDICLTREKVEAARGRRLSLASSYRKILAPLNASFLAEHPLDFPWRFSFLIDGAERFVPFLEERGIPAFRRYPPLDIFFPGFAKSRDLQNSHRLGAQVCNLLVDDTVSPKHLSGLAQAVTDYPVAGRALARRGRGRNLLSRAIRALRAAH